MLPQPRCLSPQRMLTFELVRPTWDSCGCVHQAVAQVFGRTLLCRDKNVASEFSKKYNLDCVTVEGDQVRCCSVAECDSATALTPPSLWCMRCVYPRSLLQVNRRGALRGGFINQDKCRLNSHTQVMKSLGALEELEDKKEKTANVVMQLSQRVSRITGELQRAEGARGVARNTANQLTKQVAKNEVRGGCRTAHYFCYFSHMMLCVVACMAWWCRIWFEQRR